MLFFHNTPKNPFRFFFNGVTLSISRGFGPCDSLAQYYTADWNKALMLQSSQEIHNLNFKKKFWLYMLF